MAAADTHTAVQLTIYSSLHLTALHGIPAQCLVVQLVGSKSLPRSAAWIRVVGGPIQLSPALSSFTI